MLLSNTNTTQKCENCTCKHLNVCTKLSEPCQKYKGMYKIYPSKNPLAKNLAQTRGIFQKSHTPRERKIQRPPRKPHFERFRAFTLEKNCDDIC